MERGPHVRSGPHLPFQSEARAQQSWGGLVWGSGDSVWFELSQAGCWDLSSQMPAVSKRFGGVGALDRLRNPGRRDSPRATFGGDCESQGGPGGRPDSQGKRGPSLPPPDGCQENVRATQGGAPAQPAGWCLETAPTCGQTSPPPKTPSERWDPPDGCEDRASRHVLRGEAPTCGEWGKTLQSPSEAHQKSQARGDALHRAASVESLRPERAPGPAPGCTRGPSPRVHGVRQRPSGRLTHLSQHRGVHTGEALRLRRVRQGLPPQHPPQPARVDARGPAALHVRRVPARPSARARV